MKNINYIIGILSIILGLISCDIIPENERLVESERVQINKNLLLLDFTDQTCVNCPAASKLIEELIEEYGGALIPVSVHAYYIFPPPSLLILVTEQGNEYENVFNKSKAHPMGSIDGQMAVTADKWRTEIDARFKIFEETEPPLKMDLFGDYDSETRNITVKSSITSYDDTENLKLMIWIIESNIVAAQQTPTGINREYIHNHIFRESINDTWGETITVEKGKGIETEHQFVLNEKYIAENVTVIGFIYNSNTYEIYQTSVVEFISK